MNKYGMFLNEYSNVDWGMMFLFVFFFVMTFKLFIDASTIFMDYKLIVYIGEFILLFMGV